MSLKSAKDEDLIFGHCVFNAIKLCVKQRALSSKFNSFKFHFSKFVLSLSMYPRAIETRNGKKGRELKSMCQT